MAYFEGLKISQIVKQLNIDTRTLQIRIKTKSEKALGYTVTFSMLRNSCLINLLNKGYNIEYIKNYMGYSSRKEELEERRKQFGYISLKNRLKILKKNNFKCVYCGSEDNLEIDHIIPISKGGNGRLYNLQTLCKKCNLGKKNEAIK